MATDPPRKPPNRLPVLDEILCSGCDACIAVCPADCIHALSDPDHPGYVTGICVIDPAACIGCSDCARICPWNAIVMVPTAPRHAQTS